MKKIVFLLSIVCLFALSAFAQSSPNFAGEWTLDKSKSKLDERMAASIESQTMKVEQTDKEIKSTVDTKRVEGAGGPPGGGQGGPPGGGMGGGRGGFGGGPATYSLDGKEVVTERETPNGMKFTTKTTAKIEGGKLEVVSKSVGPDGTERTSKQTWELSGDGKTLTVKRTQPSRDGGETTTESVYTKKS